MSDPARKELPEVRPDDSRHKATLTPFVVRALLGVALLGLLLKLYGIAPIVRSLARERLSFFTLALAIYLGGQAMSSYRWMLVARILDLGGRWRDYLGWYFIGMFTNLFVPGLIGGDAARSTCLGLRQGRIGSAVASVAADRGIGLLALIWFAMIAAMLSSAVTLPVAAVRSCAVITIITLTGYLVSPVLAPVGSRLPGVLAKVAAPMIPYLERPLALVPAIILSVLLQMSLAYAQYLIALGMGLSIPLAAMMVVVPMANVAAALPLTLNGLGIREGAYLVLFGAAGVAHQDAIALGLLWFSCTMVGGVAGLIPFMTTPLPQAQKAP